MRMGQVMDHLNKCKVFIDDSAGASVAELRAKGAGSKWTWSGYACGGLFATHVPMARVVGPLPIV